MHPNAYSPVDWEKIMTFSATRGTPFLVLLLDRVRQKFQAFRTHFPSAKIYYAVKANPGKEVLTLLRDLGSYFDIASVYELDQVLDLALERKPEPLPEPAEVAAVATEEAAAAKTITH